MDVRRVVAVQHTQGLGEGGDQKGFEFPGGESQHVVAVANQVLFSIHLVGEHLDEFVLALLVFYPPINLNNDEPLDQEIHPPPREPVIIPPAGNGNDRLRINLKGRQHGGDDIAGIGLIHGFDSV